ncbi:transcriptional regulator GcvA [Sphingomonas gilva]|uniref:transcriptional regulator GcvA n=1 Tax=Sphingomonas gilva TaxID=2305907 RepID=UPI001FE4863D|nr:transcriptional regulator GcvA [Sphingomonas gilva]
MSLNALRAFEAAARHLSFTRAGLELSVTQAAVSHQVKSLEARLGAPLFRRTARGLVLTDEGHALLPTLTEAFERMSRVLGQFHGGRLKEVLTLSVVGTFAVGWLLPRLSAFRAAHPNVDLRLLTNNNRVDLAGESLDYAIRFGDGVWPGCEAERVAPAPFAPLASPALAEKLRRPADLAEVPLLRSYRVEDWPRWFAAAGVSGVTARGPLFDSSWIMVQAAVLGEGVALAPPSMFAGEIAAGRIVQPFAVQVDAGAYWLARLRSRPVTRAMAAFRGWLADARGAGHDSAA